MLFAHCTLHIIFLTRSENTLERPKCVWFGPLLACDSEKLHPSPKRNTAFSRLDQNEIDGSFSGSLEAEDYKTENSNDLLQSAQPKKTESSDENYFVAKSLGKNGLSIGTLVSPSSEKQQEENPLKNHETWGSTSTTKKPTKKNDGIRTDVESRLKSQPMDEDSKYFVTESPESRSKIGSIVFQPRPRPGQVEDYQPWDTIKSTTKRPKLVKNSEKAKVGNRIPPPSDVKDFPKNFGNNTDGPSKMDSLITDSMGKENYEIHYKYDPIHINTGVVKSTKRLQYHAIGAEEEQDYIDRKSGQSESRGKPERDVPSYAIEEENAKEYDQSIQNAENSEAEKLSEWSDDTDFYLNNKSFISNEPSKGRAVGSLFTRYRSRNGK